MLVGDIREDDLIHSLFESLVADLTDDTACLQPRPEMDVLCSTDSLVEGIHFLRHVDPALIGQKLVRVNASDLLSSGAQPRWLSLAMSLPKDLPVAWLRRWVTGLSTALSETGMALTGGDTTASPGTLFFSATVLGEVPKGKRWTRTGASVGDVLAITGSLGEAQLGLAAMLRGPQAELDQMEHAFLQRHFCPPFRGSFVSILQAHQVITAMMDLSDGLATDLPRLCKASGVACQLELSRLPIAATAVARGYDPARAFEGGEEFELMLTFPKSAEALVRECARATHTPFRVLGQIVAREQGMLTLHGQPFAPGPGWQHFA